MSDTNMPLLIGLTSLAAALICIGGLAVLAWLEYCDERDRDRRAEAADAASRCGPGGQDFDAWEREMAEARSRAQHPSNRERGL